MKKYITVIVFLIFASHSIFSQKSKMDQIKAERVAYITQELSLTSAEAEKFWPVFNEYSEKRHHLKKETRQLKREMKTSIENEENKEAELFEKILSKEEEEIQLIREYLPKFKSVLPENKVYKLYIAEEKFKRYMLKKLKQSR